MGAELHGKNAVLWLDDQSGTCRNVSGDLTNITLNRSKNLPETTTFGDNSVQREVDGIRDAGLDVSAIFRVSGDPSSIIGLLDQMYGGSLVSRAQYLPAGSLTGCPIYTSSMRMTTYAVTQPVDGVVTATFGLALATGSVLAACCV